MRQSAKPAGPAVVQFHRHQHNRHSLNNNIFWLLLMVIIKTNLPVSYFYLCITVYSCAKAQCR
jgi:hypothetical protein